MEKKSRKGMWGCLFLVAFIWLGLMGLGLGFFYLIGQQGQSTSFSLGSDPVAVVKIEGPIYESLNTLKELHSLGQNKSVKAVVVRVDSPGGAVGPSQEIFKELIELKKNKVVVVSMGTVAASGGYYIASAANKIVASPGTITGSIGVIMELVGLRKLAEKIYLNPQTIKSGRYKDAGNPFKELTEEDRSYLQDISDNMYHQFLSDVSKMRSIPMDKMKVLAQGKIYTGLQAKNIGLVDELGNIYDAIDLAKREAQLPPESSVRWPREKTSFEKFFEGDAQASLIQKWLGWHSSQLPTYLLPSKHILQQ